MNRVRIDIIVIGLLLMVGVCAKRVVAQSLSVEVSKDSIWVGDTLSVRLDVKASKGADIILTEVPDTLVGGLELFSPPQSDTLTYDDEMGYHARFTLVVTSYDSGWMVVPGIPVLVRYSGMLDTLCSEPSMVYVSLLPVDTELEGELQPIRPPLVQRITWKEIFPWLLVLLLVGILVLIIYYGIRWFKVHKESPQEKVEEVQDTRSAREIALEALRQLLQREAWKIETPKAFYTQFSDILRNYISKQWNVRTREETTSNIIAQLHRVETCSVTMAREYRELLNLSDMTKFARFEPHEERYIDSVKRAIRLVESSSAYVEEMKRKTLSVDNPDIPLHNRDCMTDNTSSQDIPSSTVSTSEEPARDIMSSTDSNSKYAPRPGVPLGNPYIHEKGDTE